MWSSTLAAKVRLRVSEKGLEYLADRFNIRFYDVPGRRRRYYMPDIEAVERRIQEDRQLHAQLSDSPLGSSL